MRRTLPLLLLLAPGALSAQLPSPSVRALGLGAYTTTARGFEAPAWNPAMLASSHASGFSIGLPQAQLEFGSNAYGLSDFTKYQGKTLSPADKADLLGRIDSAAGLDVRTVIGVAPVGLSIWRFAVSIGTAGDMDASLGKDALNLAFYGNASRTTPFTVDGTTGHGWAATTLAGSFAWPFQLPAGRLSVGVTLKKIWGHALGQAAVLAGSQLQIGPTFNAHASGQVIYTSYSSDSTVGVSSALGGYGSPGTGSGIDVGGLLELGHLTIGAVLVNAVGSMKWDPSRLTYERSADTLTQSSGGTITNRTVNCAGCPLTGAQIDADPVAKAFRDSLLAHASFARVLRAGVSWHMGGFLLAADGQVRLSQGLDRQPARAVSGGAEYVLLGVLPVRAGIATDLQQSITLSAGTGLYLGPLHFDFGVADIKGSTNPGVRVGAGLGIIF
jgi:hypothetical protein